MFNFSLSVPDFGMAVFLPDPDSHVPQSGANNVMEISYRETRLVESLLRDLIRTWPRRYLGFKQGCADHTMHINILGISFAMYKSGISTRCWKKEQRLHFLFIITGLVLEPFPLVAQ